ncbi:MAG TPA: hypothetical protein VGL26_01285 [Jatrophihabitans sp.]|jgi:hypothetical protein
MRSPTGARDQLNPAARVLWRGDHTVQLELGDDSVLLDGVTEHAVRSLTFRGPAESPDEDDADGQLRRPRDPLAPVRRILEARGMLWPRTQEGVDERLSPPTPRLAGELSALAARHGERAADVLTARRHATVAIHGTGRAGPIVAAILAASGVGRVYSGEIGEARLHHLAPGGIAAQDEGTFYAAATAAAVRRAAPEVQTTQVSPDIRPDLVVLAHDEPIDEDKRNALHAYGSAHLPVSATSGGAVLGPLVIPGLTSCLRCADLHRVDRDPAWPALAVQLQTARRPRDGSAAALVSAIAGIAAMQVLAYLDGEDPASIEGTLELHPPDWRLRRRTRPHHPDCECASNSVNSP